MTTTGATPIAPAATPASADADTVASPVAAPLPVADPAVVAPLPATDMPDQSVPADGDAASAQTAVADAVAATPAAPVQAMRPQTTAMVGQPAAPKQIGAHAPQSPGLGGAFIALLLVLGLILGMAWLLKRLPGGGFRPADGLRIVASIPLGAKERAAVVQVGDEQLLIGIGPGGVRTLHVLPQPLRAPEPAQMPSLKTLPDFKQMLAERLRRTPR